MKTITLPLKEYNKLKQDNSKMREIIKSDAMYVGGEIITDKHLFIHNERDEVIKSLVTRGNHLATELRHAKNSIYGIEMRRDNELYYQPTPDRESCSTLSSIGLIVFGAVIYFIGTLIF